MLTDALLAYFLLLNIELKIDDSIWQVRILPHAHLRMVQHGISTHDIEDLVTRFAKTCKVRGEPIIEDYYGITGRTQRHHLVTLRVAVEEITAQTGRVRVITVYLGSGWTEEGMIVRV